MKLAAINKHVEKVIAISTDKAVKPVNAMGMTKALQEKILLSPEMRNADGTIFSVVRYGNVIGSRGSVIPLFKERIEERKDLEITSREMTRFWLTLDNAIDLVLKALADSKGGEIYVMKRPACLIADLAEIMAAGRVNVVERGIRPGEKVHETLVHEEEMRRAVEDDRYFTIYPPGTPGIPPLKSSQVEYTSQNTVRMTKKEVRKMLVSSKFL